jgi:hypothetical protein
MLANKRRRQYKSLLVGKYQTFALTESFLILIRVRDIVFFFCGFRQMKSEHRNAIRRRPR